MTMDALEMGYNSTGFLASPEGKLVETRALVGSTNVSQGHNAATWMAGSNAQTQSFVSMAIF